MHRRSTWWCRAAAAAAAASGCAAALSLSAKSPPFLSSSVSWRHLLPRNEMLSMMKSAIRHVPADTENNNSDAKDETPAIDREHPAQLIPELCRQFYHL